MKAVFEIKEVRQSWHNPLEPKKISTKEAIAREFENFEITERGEPLFRLLRIQANQALVEYNRAYTLKSYEQPSSRSLWIAVRESAEFSSLWNSNGITKKLTLKSIEED